MTGDDKEEMARLKELLAQEFEIKELGRLQYFLGIEVARSKKGIFISQRKYILDLLGEIGMLGCKPAESPIESNHKLQVGNEAPVDKGIYQRLSAPGKGLLFSKHDHLRIEAFTDADWAGSLDDRRSTNSYCTLVGGNLVTWRSKKQSVVARSSAKKLVEELRLAGRDKLSLYCDNKAAISIAHNPVHDRKKHIEID
ncbi:hypothetical protein K2173_001845 [Erythroxylum novogranatense]|uniref:Reverse transcriptase Ty1/copia-type domain-containing protein n=1 Tax=Erythroxylum novogranatense TaxID=1862640 RepID=A0AAV8TQM9_9ROSI|nr:hypothetical protein K2173_001845 [Erythroxylum novogranatense]